MSAAERHYAQIEKEALAATWACEKFRTYLLGLDFTIETDHKPLVPLLTTKCLSALPPRIIRFRLRLSHFSYTVIHVPGKFLYTADALSRSMSPTAATEVEDCSMEDFVHSVVTSLPASPNTLDAYRRAQKQDPISRQLLEFCSIGWPAKEKVDPGLRLFHSRRWPVAVQLTYCNPRDTEEDGSRQAASGAPRPRAVPPEGKVLSVVARHYTPCQAAGTGLCGVCPERSTTETTPPSNPTPSIPLAHSGHRSV